MKKLFLASLLLIGLTAQAATVSMNIASGSISNLPTILGTSANVRYVLLQSPIDAAATCYFYDSASATNALTTAAYIATTRYATNVITTWTNYYGVVNSITNVALAQVTNTVAQATTLLPVMLSLSSATNATTEFDGLNVTFSRGIAVTNTCSKTITVTVGYSQ